MPASPESVATAIAATLDRLHFDLTTLRLFEATAELGAVTKAAERIFLAPAAASRRIQEFEAQFGIALFERLPHGMALTDAGRALLAHVRSMMHSVARMQDDATAFRQGNMGVVRLAACTSAVLQFLAQDIRLCQEQYPGIKIDLLEANSQGVLEAVTRGVADIGIYESTLGGTMLPTQAYREDRLVLAVPHGHPLAKKRRAALEDILPHEVIGLSEGAALSLSLGRLAAQSSQVLHMRIMVRSFHSMAAMIAQGIGIGLMPDKVADLLVGANRFKTVPVEGEWATRRFVLCHQPVHAMSGSGMAVAAMLAASAVRAAKPGKVSRPVSQNAKPASAK
ncbi:LysR family transcriptional regulator [Herbaspirillum sp. SJZ099]|uniref:LysR family transcriptional regulator n=1 Tax=Herbaspirillum sp. SJZ099 TaxID=2572916 RepID=UPI0011A5E7B7|nr:LysR substrate-binding domain-containing protein [Herbaspirillum sp. SJZ099]TWC71404.1 DNA-binding transcriptional LysR family regulator [Herbaspirillum sp. SJZ099]